MTDPKYLNIESKDGVTHLTFNRPKHNVFDIDMMHELNAQLDAVQADSGLKCLVLRGAGPSWCAGVEVGDHKPEAADAMIAVFNGIFERIHRLEVPVIAAVHGACLGGGMEVAIACDIIVAAPKAVFGQPEIKLGFFPPYAAIRLPQIVGPARAVEICTTGKRYTAAEARDMGLVGHLTEENRLEETIAGITADIADCSPLIIRLNKRAVNRHLGLGFSAALGGVSDLFLHTLMKTEDTLEGIASFEERRRPVWKNR
jgi:cyclohexa-1,5-dienecarbonyl-CoA hydratase